MKKAALIVCVLVSLAARASADHLGLYTDETATSCFRATLPPPPAISSVYLIQRNNEDGGTAAQFKVDDASSLYRVAQTTPYIMLGGWYTGASVYFNACIAGDIVIVKLDYLWLLTPTTCADRLDIVGDPTQGPEPYLTTVACHFGFEPTPTTSPFFFAAGCEGPCLPVGVEKSTWGSVKALYR